MEKLTLFSTIQEFKNKKKELSKKQLNLNTFITTNMYNK